MQLARVLAVLSVSLAAFSQTRTQNTQALDKAEGVPLQAKATVQSSVGVTAVLLTQPAVGRLFGKEIANTYAVAQLTVSNRSADAAFVIHSAYIDISNWALSGGTSGFVLNTSDDYVRGNSPHRIVSVESRIARGQSLDAQQWTARNWTIRILTLVGSLAAGYSFSVNEIGIAKGIAAFNGTLVPGVAMAWPDGLVAQQNRISDFGYQTNKVIGKQSADVIVCFFPINMFLSPTLRQEFLKFPGLFLSPYQILFGDKHKEIRNVLGITDNYAEQLRKLLPCYSRARGASTSASAEARPELSETLKKNLDDSCRSQFAEPASQDYLILLDYIGRFGLQNIGVYVDGIMTVDIDTVPASIDQVEFDADASKADFWIVSGVRMGTLQCRFCANGQVSILEADKLGLTDVTTVTQGSDDRKLKFSFRITKPVETGQSLTFVITKKPVDPKKTGQEVKSTPFVYTVNYITGAPSVAKVAVADKKVTVTGSGFLNTKANPLSVTLHSEANGKDVSVALPEGQAADKLTFDLPSLPPGCWSVHVKVGSMEASAPDKPDQKILSATPKLTDAVRNANANSITVKGEQLADVPGCAGQNLKFQLQQAASTGGTPPQPLDVTHKVVSPTEATLSLPATAKTGEWTVHVLQGASDVSNTKLR
jgi:hypothetical protein